MDYKTVKYGGEIVRETSQNEKCSEFEDPDTIEQSSPYERNLTIPEVYRLLSNTKFLKMVCAEYNIDFLPASIAYGCNNDEANKALENYLAENYNTLTNHKSR